MPTKSIAKMSAAVTLSILSIVGSIVAVERAHAETEIARIPWVITGTTACQGSSCRVFFPQVDQKRRLEIRSVSCFIRGADGTFLQEAFLGIDNARNPPRLALAQNAPRTILSITYFEFTHSVFFGVTAGHRPNISVEVSSNIFSIECALSGELVVLS